MNTFLTFDPTDGFLLERPLASVYKTGVELLGVKNGVNNTFTTPEVFDPDTLNVSRNGVNLLLDQAGSSDFQIAESGGAGTGFDTVIFTGTNAPIAEEILLADYFVG